MKLLVLIPSFNTGPGLLSRTLAEAAAQWPNVWVVIDGSTDGSAEAARRIPGVRVMALEKNQGKGAAIEHGIREAAAAGFTHVLTMDADGQHPATHLPLFAKLAARHPEALLLGCPVFGPEAPQLRVQGRKISNAWTHIETFGWGIGDSLFGMRVYPLEALTRAFASTRFGRRFDFDTEMAVRIAWQGVPVVNVPTPVRYLSGAQGGVSQFRYGRDNALLTWMHARLLVGFIARLPLLIWRRIRGGNPLRHLPR